MAKYDMVKMHTSTTGTGTMTLTTAVTGFRSFADVVSIDGERFTYTIIDGVNWEVGIGQYTIAGTILSRETVLGSSNGGAKINLSGSATVAITTSGHDIGIEAHWDSATTTNITNGSTTQLTIAAGDFWLQDYGYVTLASNTFTFQKEAWFRVHISVKISSGSLFNGGIQLIVTCLSSANDRRVAKSYRNTDGGNIDADTLECEIFGYFDLSDTLILEIKNNCGSTVTAEIQAITFEYKEHPYFSL